jgi:Flp pilus assembly protein TadD
MMKRIITIAALLLVFLSLSAQSDRYEQRYNLLVSKVGNAGVGVETLLDNWAKADSTNENLLKARFNYYYTKAQSSQIVKKPSKKYLGMEPLLSLKDTSGTNIYYFQEVIFDDELFGQAVKAVDKAVGLYPDNIDYRFLKANAYMAYEKESPDMALAYLLDLAGKDAQRTRPWTYEGKKAGMDFLQSAMQEYCYSFYQIGSPQAMRAFLVLSEEMLRLHPDNTDYMNNIGSYHMVASDDYKTAMKWYRKVLKKDASNMAALQNSVVAARKAGNRKLEDKYRQMLDRQKAAQ